MEKPGKLYDYIGDIPTHTDDPQLSWEQMAPHIQEGLDERRGRRRWPFFWLFLGLGLGIGFLLSPSLQEKKPLSAQAQDVDNSLLSAKEVTVEAQMENLTATSPQSVDLSSTPQNSSSTPALNTTQVIANTSQSAAPTPRSIPPQSADASTIDVDQTEAQISKALPSLPPNTSQPPSLANAELATFTEQATTAERALIVLPLTPLTATESPAIRTSVVDTAVMPSSNPLHVFNPEAPITNRARSFFAWAGSSRTSLDQRFAFASSQMGTSVEIGLQTHLTSKWHWSIGVSYNYDRMRTSFVQRTPVRLYRPGTVDTIYRYGTGQEVEITTDTIPGTRIRFFSKAADFNELGLPVQLGFRKHWNKLSLIAELGIIPTLSYQNADVVASADYEISTLAEGNSWAFDLSGQAAIGLEVPFGKGHFGVRYALGYQADLPDRSSSSVARQRQAVQLGYRWEW